MPLAPPPVAMYHLILRIQAELQAEIDALTITGGAVPITRTIAAGTGLTGGGDLSANRTLTVAFGTTSTTVCVGNDARLSDARTPTTHTHTASQISDSTTIGRTILTAADAAAVRTAISAPLSTTTISAGTGLTGGGDLSANRTLTVAYGTTSTTATVGNDTRVVNAVQTTRQVIAGTGLTGGGDLSADRTLTVAYGTTSTTATVGNDTRVVNAVQTTRQVIAGTGLTGGGDLSADRTLTVAYGSTSTTACVGNDARLTAPSLGTNWTNGASGIIAGASRPAAIANAMYWVAVVIPVACTLTGFRYRKGASTVAANVIGGLYDAAGNRVAVSGTVAQGTTANAILTIAFGSTYAAAAGLYWVGLIASSTNVDFFGWQNDQYLGPGSTVTQGSFVTPSTFTPPATTVQATAAVVPMVTTY